MRVRKNFEVGCATEWRNSGRERLGEMGTELIYRWCKSSYAPAKAQIYFSWWIYLTVMSGQGHTVTCHTQVSCVCTGTFETLPTSNTSCSYRCIKTFNHSVDYMVYKSSLYKAVSTYSVFPQTFSVVFSSALFLFPLYLPFLIIPSHSWSSVVCQDLLFWSHCPFI
jgi:hypothetical protein